MINYLKYALTTFRSEKVLGAGPVQHGTATRQKSQKTEQFGRRTTYPISQGELKFDHRKYK